jgi:4-amino-4-deoxy-L-arabinose transferase-like glycosyltransferase
VSAGESAPGWKMGRRMALAAAVFLLLLSYGLMVSSALRKSATVDEQSHLFRGAAYLETGATHFLLGHPLMASTLSALPLLTEPELRLPVANAAWSEGDWSVAGDLFLWELASQPLRVLFLGRLAAIWITLLLGALVLRWGRQLGGWATGVAAAFLLVLDPNIIAHGRLITGDLPLTFFYLLTFYGYWRYAGAAGRNRAGWPGLVVAGSGFGLAAASKFNAAVALPTLALVALVISWRRRDWRPVAALVPLLLVAWLVIAAVYGFQLWHGFLPGGSIWDDLLWQSQYVQKSHDVFLFGRVASESWWYYFPAAFLLKTPLPALLLLVVALLAHLVRRSRGVWRSGVALFLLLPPAVYLAASMVAALNIGYRYLIPALPFLYLFAAGVLLRRSAPESKPVLRWATAALLLLLAARTIAVWPDYLSFFNAAAGREGWRLLADSNVDWGQDLPALARWQAEEESRAPLYLSYFGTANPSAYGVRFRALPTWDPAPEQEHPATQTYDPADPAPGLYAISANNLHGIVLDEQREAFAWFRAREPLARIGGSIFVYEVPARGPATNLALSGVQPATLASGLRATLASNDLRVRWFDHETSFVWPAGGGWFAVPAGAGPPAALAPFWPARPEASSGGQSLYRVTAGTWPSWLQPAVPGDGPLRFRGAQFLAAGGGDVELLTAWEVAAVSERPLKIFVHALDAAGSIAGQWDGLDVPPAYWSAGDVFVQSHRLPLAGTAPAVRYVIGVYDGETLVRLSEHTLPDR